jgi:hypothetical protein
VTVLGWSLWGPQPTRRAPPSILVPVSPGPRCGSTSHGLPWQSANIPTSRQLQGGQCWTRCHLSRHRALSSRSRLCAVQRHREGCITPPGQPSGTQEKKVKAPGVLGVSAVPHLVKGPSSGHRATHSPHVTLARTQRELDSHQSPEVECRSFGSPCGELTQGLTTSWFRPQNRTP